MKKKSDLGDFECCMVVVAPENDSDQSFFKMDVRESRLSISAIQLAARLNFLRL